LLANDIYSNPTEGHPMRTFESVADLAAREGQLLGTSGRVTITRSALC
jgi:hypothetical protein